MSDQLISDHQILYEDNHLIAVWKEPKVLVQGDKTGDKNLTESLANYLKVKYNKPGNVFAGLIHRLDRPVSGLVLFAKTSKALARMNALFQSREVQKTYLAIVEGKVSSPGGHIESYLKKDEAKNKSFAVSNAKNGYKKAELDFRLIQILERYSLLEVSPKTGRHHQIRAQLSNMGNPIKGDLKYGAKRSNQDGSICLHAWKLEFIHPIKKEKITIVAPPPTIDVWASVEI